MRSLAIGLAVIVVLIIGAWLVRSAMASYDCWREWGSTSFEWRVARMSCQIKHPTFDWIPANKFRAGGD